MDSKAEAAAATHQLAEAQAGLIKVGFLVWMCVSVRLGLNPCGSKKLSKGRNCSRQVCVCAPV